MPTWGEILKELSSHPNAQGRPDFDAIRRGYLTELAAHTGRDTILYATKWTQGGDVDPGKISIVEEDVQGLMEVVRGLRSGKLDIVIHSPGGSPEATEAIVTYLRSRFEHIRLIVPQAAMSAATLLACACDEVVLGAHSSLGPIDPQMILPSRDTVQVFPAQAILDQFERAKEECKDPQLLGAWIPVLSHYGPALLMQCVNALALAESLASEWLAKWMLRADPDGAAKAAKIAATLKDHTHFKSHARHISREKAREMGFVVSDLESDQRLQDLVLSIFHTSTQTFDGTPAVKLIENQHGRAFIKMQQQVALQVPFPLMIPPQPQPNAPDGGQAN